MDAKTLQKNLESVSSTRKSSQTQNGKETWNTKEPLIRWRSEISQGNSQWR